MSEETEVQEPQVTTEPAKADEKPAGYHPVDPATDSPEKIQERLDYLYKQVKPSQREVKELRTLVADQSKLIDELHSGMYAVVDHLKTEATTKSEGKLREDMKVALENGDTTAYIELNEKLTELKIEKNKPKATTPKKTETQKQAYAGAKQVSDDAFDSGELSAEDNRYVESYIGEKDDNGRLLRPWTVNKSNDPDKPDPEFMEGLAEAHAVFTNKRYANWTMAQKMAELDKRMGVEPPKGGQSVMGGNFTSRPKGNKITLSQKQQEIAVRTKYGSSKGAKSDSEYMEAYRKQIEKVKTGARQ